MKPKSYLNFRIVPFTNRFGIFYDIEYFDEGYLFGIFPVWKTIKMGSQSIFGPIKFKEWPDDTYGFETLSDAEKAIEEMVEFVAKRQSIEPKYYTYKYVEEKINA